VKVNGGKNITVSVKFVEKEVIGINWRLLLYCLVQLFMNLTNNDAFISAYLMYHLVAGWFVSNFMQIMWKSQIVVYLKVMCLHYCASSEEAHDLYRHDTWVWENTLRVFGNKIFVFKKDKGGNEARHREICSVYRWRNVLYMDEVM